jgi:hypothetical protein
MKLIISIVALIYMSTSAFAECEKPAYQHVTGSRLASAAVLPLAAALTIVTIPAAVVGVATRNESLATSTPNTACFTGRLVRHTVVGNR